MDDTDRRLLQCLVTDSRMSLRDLARAVGMSSPGVSERLVRLQDRGLLRAYTIEVDPSAWGWTVQAIVRIRPLPGKNHIVLRLIENTGEIVECDKVTGDDCYVCRVFATSFDHLDGIVEEIAEIAQTHTAIVKSQPVRRRPPPFGLLGEMKAISPARP